MPRLSLKLTDTRRSTYWSVHLSKSPPAELPFALIEFTHYLEWSQDTENGTLSLKLQFLSNRLPSPKWFIPFGPCWSPLSREEFEGFKFSGTTRVYGKIATGLTPKVPSSAGPRSSYCSRPSRNRLDIKIDKTVREYQSITDSKPVTSYNIYQIHLDPETGKFTDGPTIVVNL